jgi:DNA-binding transcriptional ArsR family regulator
MVGARLFQALSDPTRLKIMSMLADGPMIVSRMVERLGCAQPAVSRHLRVLKDVTLIQGRRMGKEVEYSLNLGEVEGAAKYLQGLLEVGEAADNRLAKPAGFAKRAQTVPALAGRPVAAVKVPSADKAEPVSVGAQQAPTAAPEPVVGWAQQARPRPQSRGPKRVSTAKPGRRQTGPRAAGAKRSAKRAVKAKAGTGRRPSSAAKPTPRTGKAKPKPKPKPSRPAEFVIKRDQDAMDDFLL